MLLGAIFRSAAILRTPTSLAAGVDEIAQYGKGAPQRMPRFVPHINILFR